MEERQTNPANIERAQGEEEIWETMKSFSVIVIVLSFAALIVDAFFWMGYCDMKSVLIHCRN